MMLVPKSHYDLFDDFFDDPFFKEDRPMPPMPPMKTDIREGKYNYIIDVDLPGFKKENIKLDITNGYLNITAKTETSTDNEDEKFIKRERYTGECSRSFFVGEDVEENEISARFDNGILSIEIPKKREEYKEEKKYIDIQ